MATRSDPSRAGKKQPDPASTIRELLASTKVRNVLSSDCSAGLDPRWATVLDSIGEHPDVLNRLDEPSLREVSQQLVLLNACRSATSHPSTSGANWTASWLIGACDIMGGKRVFKNPPTSRASVHDVIMKGVPYSALVYVIEHASVLKDEEVAEAVGVSTRTLRRQRDTPTKSMPPDLASRTWSFAETLAKATEVMGGREAAERWMSASAMGLDGQRPIELLRTLQGAELVNEFLDRLAYGVYN